MKKNICSIIAMVIIASMMLAGCGAKNTDVPSVSNGVENTKPSTTEPVVTNEPVNIVVDESSLYVEYGEYGKFVTEAFANTYHSADMENYWENLPGVTKYMDVDVLGTTTRFYISDKGYVTKDFKTFELYNEEMGREAVAMYLNYEGNPCYDTNAGTTTSGVGTTTSSASNFETVKQKIGIVWEDEFIVVETYMDSPTITATINGEKYTGYRHVNNNYGMEYYLISQNNKAVHYSTYSFNEMNADETIGKLYDTTFEKYENEFINETIDDLRLVKAVENIEDVKFMAFVDDSNSSTWFVGYSVDRNYVESFYVNNIDAWRNNDIINASTNGWMEDGDGKVTSLIINSPDGAVDIQVMEYVGTLENGMVVYKSINTQL